MTICIVAQAGLGAVMSAGMGALTAQALANRANAVVDQLFKDQVLPLLQQSGISEDFQQFFAKDPELLSTSAAKDIRKINAEKLELCVKNCVQEENKKINVSICIGIITVIALSIFCAYMATPVGASVLAKVGVGVVCGASGVLGGVASMVYLWEKGSIRTFMV